MVTETPLYDQLVTGLDIDPDEIREDQVKRHLAWVARMAEYNPDVDRPKWRANYEVSRNAAHPRPSGR